MLFENLNPVSIDLFNDLGPLEFSMSFPLATACFFSLKALLFYALTIELHLLQLSVFVFDDMYIMLLVLQAIAVHQKLVPSLYVMYIVTP